MHGKADQGEVKLLSLFLHVRFLLIHSALDYHKGIQSLVIYTSSEETF